MLGEINTETEGEPAKERTEASLTHKSLIRRSQYKFIQKTLSTISQAMKNRKAQMNHVVSETKGLLSINQWPVADSFPDKPNILVYPFRHDYIFFPFRGIVLIVHIMTYPRKVAWPCFLHSTVFCYSNVYTPTRFLNISEAAQNQEVTWKTTNNFNTGFIIIFLTSRGW